METIIDAIKYLKENGCIGIACEECPLNEDITDEREGLCHALGDLAFSAGNKNKD